MQLVESGERKTVKVWEVEEAIALEQVEQTRKRQRRTVVAGQGLTSSPEVVVSEIPFQDQVTMAVHTDSSLHFYFFIGSNGTILRIGSLYSLDFCKDSVFICTSISRNKDLFKFKFLLCSLVEKKVESIDRGVSCTVNDVKHVSCQSDVVIGSKGKGLVDKIICEAWDRVLFCQVKMLQIFLTCWTSERVAWPIKYVKVSTRVFHALPLVLRSLFTLAYLIQCMTLRSWA